MFSTQYRGVSIDGWSERMTREKENPLRINSHSLTVPIKMRAICTAALARDFSFARIADRVTGLGLATITRS